MLVNTSGPRRVMRGVTVVRGLDFASSRLGRASSVTLCGDRELWLIGIAGFLV